MCMFYCIAMYCIDIKGRYALFQEFPYLETRQECPTTKMGLNLGHRRLSSHIKGPTLRSTPGLNYTVSAVVSVEPALCPKTRSY